MCRPVMNKQRARGRKDGYTRISGLAHICEHMRTYNRIIKKAGSKLLMSYVPQVK